MSDGPGWEDLDLFEYIDDLDLDRAIAIMSGRETHEIPGEKQEAALEAFDATVERVIDDHDMEPDDVLAGLMLYGQRGERNMMKRIVEHIKDGNVDESAVVFIGDKHDAIDDDEEGDDWRRMFQ